MSQFAPQIHRLELPTPFHVGTVNAYLLEGSPLTLFDCGLKGEEYYLALVDKLAEHGYQISDLEQVIVSHHHTDHIGLADRIIAESGAQLAAHQYTVPFLETPDKPRDYHQSYFAELCVEGGVPLEAAQRFQMSYRWIEQFSNGPVQVDRILQEGDLVRAGDTEWHVLYTPGHAGDLICLYDPISGILIANDHLILKISSNPLAEPPPEPGAPRPHRLVEYLHHMQRVASLDIHIAFSGHGDPIQDVPALVNKRVAFHHKRAGRILTYFDSEPLNLWQLTQKLFSHVPDGEKFLAISEVLGHIDILEENGQIKRQYHKGILYWEQDTVLHHH